MKIFLLTLLFALHIFLRFYDIDDKNLFGWDQVDNAWAAKNMIVDHKIPLLGMQVKQNTGFYIGPAYYYYIVPFYWLFDLDPVASGVIAGITSIFTFFVLFFLTKRLLGINIALIATFIYTVSFEIIIADRAQWPVNFIPPLSLIIFYALYNVLLGKVKYFILLAIAVGASFHINFTSIFYPIMIFLTLPLLPRTKEAIKYSLFSIPFFLIWLLPQFVSEIQASASSSKNILSYVNTYYHGFHLRRVLQLANDAFIEFGTIPGLREFNNLKFFLLPLFGFLFLYKKLSREKILFLYLVCIWIVVPWFVLSLYSGEITNYYFSQTRPIVLAILAFLIYKLFAFKKLQITIPVLMVLAYYTFFNITHFMNYRVQGIKFYKEKGYQQVKETVGNEFIFGAPESYLYYYYSRKLYGQK